MDIIYHSMPTTWKNKTMEQEFNYAESTIKEMTDFIETRVEILEPKEDRNKSSAASNKPKEKKKERLRLQCRARLAKNQPKLAAQLVNTAFHTENAVILQIIAMIYVQW